MRAEPDVRREEPEEPVRAARRRRSLFHHEKPPTVPELYSELRKGASLRLKSVPNPTTGEPEAYAALLVNDATVLAKVKSREFFEAVDSYRLSVKKRLAPVRVSAALADYLTAEVRDNPVFRDELPIGSRGRDWGYIRPMLEEELTDPVGKRGLTEATLANPPDEGIPNEPAPISKNLDGMKVLERPDYVPRVIGGLTDLEILHRALVAKANVLITGPPGGGKSELFRAFAAEENLPFFAVDASDSLDVEDECIGRYVKIGRSWRYVEGVLTRMARAGGVFVLNELSAARNNASTRLFDLLSSRVLTIPGRGVSIPCHASFLFGATMNDSGDGDGGRGITGRLRSRFDVILDFRTYDPAVEARLVDDPFILRAFASIRADPRVRTACSTRLLRAYARNRETYGEELAKEFLVAAFRDEEREVVAELLGPFLPSAVPTVATRRPVELPPRVRPVAPASTTGPFETSVRPSLSFTASRNREEVRGPSGPPEELRPGETNREPSFKRNRFPV